MVSSLFGHMLIIQLFQHRFLKPSSCLTNLLCFLEEITKWGDILDHKLVLKLKAFVMRNGIVIWIGKWLADR